MAKQYLFDEDLDMIDAEELRVKDDNCISTSSVFCSDYEITDLNTQASRASAAPLPTEFDRFIPRRAENGGETASANFETKEMLFSASKFSCSHTASEMCDCEKLA